MNTVEGNNVAEGLTLDTAPLSDTYLGYGIYNLQSGPVALPLGWNGDILSAETVPQIRRRIWMWWHQVDFV